MEAEAKKLYVVCIPVSRSKLFPVSTDINP